MIQLYCSGINDLTWTASMAKSTDWHFDPVVDKIGGKVFDNGFADLGDNPNISFSFSSPFQHFYEELEQYSYSFNVPNTLKNSKLFSGNFGDISLVIDNRVVMKRLKPVILEESLTEFKVTLNKTVVYSADEISNNIRCSANAWWTFADMQKAWNDPTSTQPTTFELEIKNDPLVGWIASNRRTVKYSIYTPPEVNIPIFREYQNVNNHPWPYTILGCYQHKNTAKPETNSSDSYPGGFSELQIPLKDFLLISTGEIPTDYKDDERMLCLPIDYRKFHLFGKIRLTFDGDVTAGSGNATPSEIAYVPKYGGDNSICIWDFSTERYDRWKERSWETGIAYTHFIRDSYVLSNFPFSAERKDFYQEYLAKGVTPKVYVSNSNTVINPVFGIDDDREQIEAAPMPCVVEFDIDEYVDLQQNEYKYMRLNIPAVLTQYYEDIAKNFYLGLDYDKELPGSPFHNAYFNLSSSNIITYNKTFKYDSDFNVRRFHYQPKWSPYQFTKKSDGEVSEVELRYSDINVHTHIYDPARQQTIDIDVPLEYNVTGIHRGWKESEDEWYKNEGNTYDIGDSDVYPQAIVKQLNPFTQVYEPYSVNTMLFINNFIQETRNEITIECLGYGFQNQIKIGDKWLVVDKAETSDFKIWKLTCLEM